MSTTPTEILETTAAALETTLAATEAAAAETVAAAESSFDFDSIKAIMDGFDPASLLPDLEGIFGSLATVCRLAVMIGPLVLLVLGLCYLFLAPKEANWYFGYRCYFGMGSEYAWRFTQRLAGMLFTGLGVGLTVVMLVISSRFAHMEVTAMAWQALECLVWQVGLVVLATVVINFTAFVHFNRKGQHRRKRRK